MLPPIRGLYRDDLLARAVYSEGAGIARALPVGVAVPADADDVAELVRWATAHDAALIARGSGSGMAGGAVGRGVIVDLSRLDAIGDLDIAHRRVWTGPGALRGAVDAAARAHGLRFPVDPSSGVFCTVGGMAATNAAGARTLRYGATRDWVTAAECVFSDGARAIVRRGEQPTPMPAAIERFLSSVAPRARSCSPALLERQGVRKESSGYALAEFVRSGDPLDVILGSEGTLCLITALELALDPIPGATASVLAAFPSLESAVEGARASREGGASASELLDRTFLEVAALGGARLVPPETETALLVEVEEPSVAEANARSRSIADACAAAGASVVRLALDASTEREVWALRHAASPILSRLDPHLKSMQFIEDAAVPPDRLPTYVDGVRSALASRGIHGVIFGHAGDAHVHVNPLIDVRVPEWRDQVDGLLEEVTSLVASLGGTLAGEHGDGRLRAPLASRTWGVEAMELFASVKRAFDPEGVFNPGVKVPLQGQRAIEEVKYDPSIAPLSPAARDALDAIERERGYARFRLSLV
ncbi:MAG TPA: FAD-binding oxidoreductase [Gemmatimonadaceae bacterium]|nr:FAD-binding oxidoreductase [Gemmatimonadaceae bacterium]